MVEQMAYSHQVYNTCYTPQKDGESLSSGISRRVSRQDVLMSLCTLFLSMDIGSSSQFTQQTPWGISSPHTLCIDMRVCY